MWAFHPVIKANPHNPKWNIYPGSTKTGLQDTNAKADLPPQSFAALGLFCGTPECGIPSAWSVLSSWCFFPVALEQVSHWPHRPVLPRKVLWWGELPEDKVGFPSYKCQTPRGTRRRKERGSIARHGTSMGLPEQIWLCPEKWKKRKSARKWWLDKKAFEVCMTHFTWMHWWRIVFKTMDFGSFSKFSFYVLVHSPDKTVSGYWDE